MQHDLAMATAARTGLLALAAAACAWFALGWVQVRDTGRATALVNGASPLRAAAVQRTRSLLDTAGTLNPDLMVPMIRAQLALDQGAGARAVAILRSVTGSEPLNFTAWTQLAFAAARAGDRRLLTEAGRHASALLPKLR